MLILLYTDSLSYAYILNCYFNITILVPISKP
jgi:hypothetical protein